MRRWLVLAALLATGCVSTYSLVEPGVNRAGDLYVVADPGWNRALGLPGSGNRQGAETWTRDGPVLNRLVFIPSVADGEALVTSLQLGKALPVFRATMLPNDIEDLAESTCVKIFGEGNAVFVAKNLRPQRFGDEQGVLFDVEASVTDSPNYRGIVGAFIANDELYFMYYLAAEPYYFEKDFESAASIIKSASLTRPPSDE